MLVEWRLALQRCWFGRIEEGQPGACLQEKRQSSSGLRGPTIIRALRSAIYGKKRPVPFRQRAESGGISSFHSSEFLEYPQRMGCVPVNL
jgi:hypothetical protein